MAFKIRIAVTAKFEIEELCTVEQRRVSDAIERQLLFQPEGLSRNRKRIDVTVADADFEFEPPLWELRVGDIRLFYDVDTEQKLVVIRAVRRKPPSKTTGEILNEKSDR